MKSNKILYLIFVATSTLYINAVQASGRADDLIFTQNRDHFTGYPEFRKCTSKYIQIKWTSYFRMWKGYKNHPLITVEASLTEEDDIPYWQRLQLPTAAIFTNTGIKIKDRETDTKTDGFELTHIQSYSGITDKKPWSLTFVQNLDNDKQIWRFSGHTHQKNTINDDLICIPESGSLQETKPVLSFDEIKELSIRQEYLRKKDPTLVYWKAKVGVNEKIYKYTEVEEDLGTRWAYAWEGSKEVNLMLFKTKTDTSTIRDTRHGMADDDINLVTLPKLENPSKEEEKKD
jgi:hypothetical protein